MISWFILQMKSEKMQVIFTSESGLKFKVFGVEGEALGGGWRPHGFPLEYYLEKLINDQGKIMVFKEIFFFPVWTL